MKTAPTPSLSKLFARVLLFPLALILFTSLACSANPFRDDPPTPQATLPAASESAPVARVEPSAAPTPVIFVELIDEPVENFNPVLNDSDAARAVQNKILPRLLAQEPQSGEPVPVGLAQGWQWSPDGRTLTLALRGDLAWSDGAPVTSLDAGFTLAAAASPAVESPLQRRMAGIENVELPDDNTLVLRLRAPDCALLQTLALPLLPAHLFAADLSDLRSNPWNNSPTVGAGPFLFQVANGDVITLGRNNAYPGQRPAIDSYLLRAERDPAARLALVSDGSAQLAADLPAETLLLPAAVGRTALLLKDGYTFLAINLADPDAAQTGLLPDGSLVQQTPHPVLGDQRVRRAIAAGVDFRAIVSAVYGPNAASLASWVLPSIPWALANDITPYAYSPAQAAALLDEAGWRDAAGDGVRENGEALLQLTLITNADNPLRVQMGERIRDALLALGFAVNFEALDFATARDAVLQQRYDLAIVGFEGLGADPAAVDFFESAADQPGAGLNFTSYQNGSVDSWLSAARMLPGCNPAERGELYRQAQRQIHADVPIIMLSGQLSHVVSSSGWQGLAPGPWAVDAGVEQWTPAGG